MEATLAERLAHAEWELERMASAASDQIVTILQLQGQGQLTKHAARQLMPWTRPCEEPCEICNG